mmetsp:Transcript_12592/g.21995  ORF Transcript_12592/g.21995 Transcript_12592/m.21995 type:complete len:266 (+) Transcript_12592:247-1044(+)
MSFPSRHLVHVLPWLTLLSLSAPIHTAAADAPIPLCDAITVFDLNSCNQACLDIGEKADVQESRDVNGLFKCYCTTTPICNDDPLCSDLLVVPGKAQEGCEALCPDANQVDVVDAVQFIGDPGAVNNNQTHFTVGCTCDGVPMCGTDFVLFSDLTYLQACTGLIESETACETYCLEAGSFTGSAWDPAAPSCVCSTDAGTAYACDDTNANSNDAEFTDCFGQVGVSAVDCPTPAPTDSSGPTAALYFYSLGGAMLALHLVLVSSV